jgi:protein-L-isoaspartate(D-aspartate) O-methyltransferase
LPIPSLSAGERVDLDYGIAREKMVTEQLVKRGIKDPRVLAAMRKVPRHLFVDEALAARAYGDYPLPIGEKQTISQPYMVALMTEALAPGPKDRILEIGTGSGYQTAILAELCSKVLSMERIRVIAEKAEKTLKDLGYSNFLIRVGDGSKGWKEEAPFEGILVTAGAPSIPKVLEQQLTDGGSLIIPVGDEFSQSLIKIVRDGDEFRHLDLTGCVFVKLIGNHGWKE